MYVFLNDKYRDRDRYRRYWPCIYLVSDQYQNLQYRTPLPLGRYFKKEKNVFNEQKNAPSVFLN